MKEKLKQDLEYVQTLYDNERILGIFLYNKIYTQLKSIGDIQTLVCYLPTFNELCSLKTKNELLMYNGHYIRIIDIREVMNYIVNQNVVFLNAILSSDNLINNRYEDIFFNYIYNNKENIFYYNKKLLLVQLYEQLMLNLEKYEQTNNRKILMDICYIRIICELYLNNAKVEQITELSKDYYIQYLDGIVTGNIQLDIEDVKFNIEEIKKGIESISDDDVNEEDIKEFENGIIEIEKLSLIPIIDNNEILSNFTDMEKQALDVILKNIKNGEGNISISKLTTETKISRPVFKNTLQKVKENQIAQVNNMGVKGTYIKIINKSFVDLYNNL